jgi:small subunit ribosomal protein S1
MSSSIDGFVPMSTDSSSNSPNAASPPAAGPLAAAVRAAATNPTPVSEAAPVESTTVQPSAEATNAAPAGGRPPRGPRGNRPPRNRKDGEDDGPRKEKPAPVFVPKKSMELGRRGRLSADMEQEISDVLGEISIDSMMADEQPKGELERESRHRAQVIELHGDNVFFSLGGKAQGVASVRSFAEPPTVGDMIDIVIRGYNNEDDLYDVMVPGGTMVVGDWSQIQEGAIVDAKVIAANTGGLECQVNDLKGFIPVSQISTYRTENMGDYVGQRLVCVITQADERRGNLILSRRAVLEREQEESKKKMLAELQPGDICEGTVRKLQDFGAFVEIGNGVDGLIHISQMSWERIKHPREVLAEGQKVRVRIEKIDPETGKIGLTLKNPEEHPWAKIDQRFPIGTTIKGPVTRIAKFGAFVKMAMGVEGLIHISELAHHKVYKVENIVKEGDEVECKILSIDPEEQRIGLSLKATLAKPEKETKAVEEEPDEPLRKPAIKRKPGPLKGGTDKPSGGEGIGLKW